MNRKELSVAVAKRANLTQASAGTAVDSTFDIIKETIATGEKVEIIGIGSFEAKLRDARTGRNPKTGETIEIPAAVVPSFKAGKTFKDYLKQHTAEFMKK